MIFVLWHISSNEDLSAYMIALLTADIRYSSIIALYVRSYRRVEKTISNMIVAMID